MYICVFIYILYSLKHIIEVLITHVVSNNKLLCSVNSPLGKISKLRFYYSSVFKIHALDLSDKIVEKLNTFEASFKF